MKLFKVSSDTLTSNTCYVILCSWFNLLFSYSPLPRHGKVCRDDLDLAEQTPWDGLREKLGLDFEESNVSWTTSMATPPTNPSTGEYLKV